jgi:outer membrane protein TolC
MADTLRALEHNAEAVHAQSQAFKTPEKALRLYQANYRAGIVNYLQILIANGQYQQARISYLQVLASAYSTVSLSLWPLGGGPPSDVLLSTVGGSSCMGPVVTKTGGKDEKKIFSLVESLLPH